LPFERPFNTHRQLRAGQRMRLPLSLTPRCKRAIRDYRNSRLRSFKTRTCSSSEAARGRAQVARSAHGIRTPRLTLSRERERWGHLMRWPACVLGIVVVAAGLAGCGQHNSDDDTAQISRHHRADSDGSGRQGHRRRGEGDASRSDGCRPSHLIRRGQASAVCGDRLR